MKSVQLLAAIAAFASLGACASDNTDTSATAPSDVKVSYLTTRGAIIASKSCAKCHGTDMLGQATEALTCPSLIGAASYTRGEFDALLTTYTTHDGDALDALMQGIPQLSSDDRLALHTYLMSLSDKT